MKASEAQVGGKHYKQLAIQPMQYSMANNLDACQHTAIKYVTRHREGAGKKDLYKALHCIMLLIEDSYEWTAEDTAIVAAIVDASTQNAAGPPRGLTSPATVTAAAPCRRLCTPTSQIPPDR